jgi:hypothetical protein
MHVLERLLDLEDRQIRNNDARMQSDNVDARAFDGGRSLRSAAFRPNRTGNSNDRECGDGKGVAAEARLGTGKSGHRTGKSGHRVLFEASVGVELARQLDASL